MNILMMTNTYKPHVGGVARSVSSFTSEFRKQGHRVAVVAPEFPGSHDEREEDIIRLPAIQRFKGSDFSVRLPISRRLSRALEGFKPDIVHSHHPFLIGDTALRVAHQFNIPIVFTHHTMWEQYTHYVPGDSPVLKKFVIRLSTGFANLCDMVFAPSQSLKEILLERGVCSPVEVVPTGMDLALFKTGSGRGFRLTMDIPEDAFVVGHLGRLAPEKNLLFLARAISSFMHKHGSAHFLLVGKGPLLKEIEKIFMEKGLIDRFHYLQMVHGPLLASAYKAMDVFAFASKSETQGLVLVEAMAAGVPVIAIDAPGAREVVVDRINGRLLAEEDEEEFVSAISWIVRADAGKRERLKVEGLKTARKFSMKECALRALSLYQGVYQKEPVNKEVKKSPWNTTLGLLKTEWDLISNVAEAAGAALKPTQSP